MPSPSICFVADSFIADENAVITGPSVQIYLLAKEFLKTGWQSRVIAYAKQPDQLPEHFDGLDITWIRQRRYLPILNFFKVFAALRKNRSDYYYQRGRDILTGKTAIYCRVTGSKFLWASSGESGTGRNKYLNQFLKKKIRNPFRLAVLFCEAWMNDRLLDFGMMHAHLRIVQTHFQENRLQENYHQPSVVIKSGHPVPQEQFRSLPLKILWIGSIKKVKRPELFIQIADALSEKNCQFIMAGSMADDFFRTSVADAQQRLPSFIYRGSVPFHESAQLISSAHILINTTDENSEGLPNAFVQAWLAGTVTVSLHSDPDGILSQIDSRLVSANLDDITKLLSFFSENPDIVADLGKQFREYAIERFSISTIVAQIQKNLSSASS